MFYAFAAMAALIARDGYRSAGLPCSGGGGVQRPRGGVSWMSVCLSALIA